MASDESSTGGSPAAEPTPVPVPAAASELAAAAALAPDLGALRPEDFAPSSVPTVMRGYERRRVEWLLLRAAEAYAYVVRQRDAARDRIRSLEADAAAAEGEARVSAASVGELTQRLASAEETVRRASEAREQAEQRLLAAEGELRQQRMRVQELEAEHGASSTGPDAEAASILVAAVRTAEELRRSSRARALATLTRARQRAAAVAAEAEREERALGEARDRRAEAERVASELLGRARSEAERVAGERREAERLAAEIGDERRRVQALLAGALSALEPTGAGPEGEAADLSSRLPDSEAGQAD